MTPTDDELRQATDTQLSRWEEDCDRSIFHRRPDHDTARDLSARIRRERWRRRNVRPDPNFWNRI